MPHPLEIGDYNSTLFDALNGFWQQFFRDTQDLQAYYQASEIYLGQVYLDFLSLVLGTSVTDVPIFNREYWKLFTIKENDLQFISGASVAQDRFMVDMPGDTVDTDFLQNTIFDPSVLYEKDVDFEVESSDGYARFRENLFRTSINEDGEYTPTPGIAWRYVTIQVGNNFTDSEILEDWSTNTTVKPGDTLRLLAYQGELQTTGDLARIEYVGAQLYFQASLLSPVVFPDPDIMGDTITVALAPPGSEVYNGTYIIAEWINSRRVRLELTFCHPAVTSLNVLSWEWHHAMYFTSFTRDHEVDYFDKKKIIGNFEDPYPLDLSQPLVYAIVRDQTDPDIVGHPLVTWAPWITSFGAKHIIPGSMKVFARRINVLGDPALSGQAVVEGEDYIVDYLRGTITITAVGQVQWDFAGSVNRCDYQYQQEVLFSGSGIIAEQIEGKVKQLSLWAPEVNVDRFTLYYNYGSMLNRFEASSETYRAFIKGIMYLYMSGPILQRIEAALNVAAGYPVVKDNEEILQEYTNGEDDSGVGDGNILVGDQFHAPLHVFGEIDVGGKLIILNPVNAVNKGVFLIENVVNATTIELESSFGLVPEAGLDWVLSRSYQKVVTTDKKTYKYPYNVPMREDLVDTLNWGVLTFSAFEVLTEAFIVADYIEDPNWWHNKVIPQLLWDTPPARRRALTRLVAHVVDPADFAQIDDPGLYVDGDDDGVISPNIPGNPAESPFRHSVGFIIFDRYMKFHMFYVEFGIDLELDDQFKEDLEDIILVAKPSYTYPYVEANDAFMDGIELLDFLILSLTFTIDFGPLEALELANNVLLVGGSPTYMSVDDYYRWLDLIAPTGIVPDGLGVPPPAVLVLPAGPIPPEQRIVKITLDATIGGLPVREGVDYTFVYEPPTTDPNAWTITPLTVWDAQPLGVGYDALAIEIANLLDHPLPDTTIGFTPIMVDGLDPGYVRRYQDIPPSGTTVSEMIDRALSLHIDTNFPMGVPYVYP
jgi:hypothetical protein